MLLIPTDKVDDSVCSAFGCAMLIGMKIAACFVALLLLQQPTGCDQSFKKG
jgi:hypothetical protein